MDMLVPRLSWPKKQFSAQNAVKLIFSFYGKRCKYLGPKKIKGKMEL